VNRVIAALVGLLVLATPASIRAQGRVPAGGSEDFRFALYQHDIKPESDVAGALNDPRHTIIVVFGDVRMHGHFAETVEGWQLFRFLMAGGAVLVATDGPAGAMAAAAGGRGQDWAAPFGIEITPNRLTAPADKCYRGKDGRPFVKPRLRFDFPSPSPYDLFKDQAEKDALPIATNLPHEMTVHAPGLFRVDNLAGYVDGTRRTLGRQLVPVAPDMNHFAISLQPRDNPAGRMIVLANRGVLTNEMVGFVKDPAPPWYHFDNDNWAFMNRTIEWLQNGPEHRSRCLFIEDGRVIDKFAVELPNTRPPVPNIPPDVIANWLLNAANPIVDEAQKRDVFNRFLDRWLGFPRLLRLFLIVATVLFIGACLRRLIRGYRKAEPAATLTPATRDSLLPRGGVVRQRTAAQLEVGNLYEAARRRVRERFDVLGGRPGRPGQMPAVLTANDLPDGPLLYQSVRWLWVLGYGETPVAVPPADWDRTNVLLERVTARAARGDWSFGQEAE
jgi:hypothetical protein